MVISFYFSIPLRLAQLKIIREKAQQLRDGTVPYRSDVPPPLTLATFIFESLFPDLAQSEADHRARRYSVRRLPTDKVLAFDASMAALDLKCSLSEADHPILFESVRRQRFDLLLMMRKRLHRVINKCDPDKVAKLKGWVDLYITGLLAVESDLPSSGNSGTSSGKTD